MDLAQLKFVVDTTDLKNASVAIKQLSEDVNKLNKPMQEASKASSNFNKKQQEVAETSSKVESATKKQISVLERQQMILEFMTQGYSKGQSSQLAYAKAAGAVTDEIQQLGKVLQTQRTLMGTDPFDKSLGAMQSLRNEYTVIKEVQRLYNAELGLSKTQMEDLAREKLRLIEKLKLEGASLSQIKQGLKDLERAYVGNASAENSITESIKARQKAIQDTAKAQSYVSAEFERVNRLTSENGNITSATNNKIIAMEKALRMSGMSAAEQVSKLNAYKKALTEIQGAAGQRQVDYLSRALGPQITDIFVGLATGQSPMMVLLQQGGQLRDQFALAGVAGSKMADMLVQASKSMITSVKDIAVAIGELLLKSIIGVGSAIASSLIAPFKMFATGVTGIINGTMTASQAIDGLKTSLVGLAKTGLFTVVAGLAALAYEYIKVTKSSTELSQAIALTGASLGMTRDQAVSFAETLSAKTGTSTLKYIDALTQFAKAGADVNASILKLSTDMEKYLGQSIDKTAQQYAEFGDEPTKALIKIAKEQGFVNEQTLRQVYNLEQAGKKTEAAKVAQEAYIASQKNAVAAAKANLDPLQELWLDIKDAISKASEAVYNMLKSGPAIAIFRTVWETIAVVVSEVWYVLKSTGKEIAGIASQIAAVMKGDFAGAAKIGEQMKADADTARKAQDELVASILDRTKAEKEGSSITAEQAQKNAQAAKSFQDRMKIEKEASDYFNSIMKEAAKLQGEASFSTNELNAAQKKMIEIIADPKFAKLSQQKQAEALASLAKASATIEETKALEELRKQNAKATEEYLKNIAAQDNAWISAFDANVAANRAVMEESEALALQASLIGATDEQRKRAIKTRQIELELAKELREIEAKKLTPEDQANFELEARKRAMQKIKNLNTEIAIDSAKKLYDGVSDAIVTALFEGGQAGKKKLRDLIVAELKKPVTVMVNAVVNTIMGNVLNSIGLGQGGSSAAGNMAGNVLGSAISNFAIAGTTIGQMGSYFATGFMNTVAGTGLQASTAAGSAIGGANGMAMQAGAYAAPVAGALGGMALNRGISGEYSTGSTMRTIQDIATVAATAVFGPLGGLVAGTISGLFNRAFGMGAKKVTGQDIVGTFSTSGASVQNRSTWKQKGGWFRSDKSGADYSAISSEAQSYFDATLMAIGDTTKKYANILGLNADTIDGINQDVTISLMGLTDEQKTAKIKDAFVSFGDRLAQELLGSFDSSGKWIAGEFVRSNETATAALERLATSLSTVNSFLKDLNFTLYDASLKSADFASTLIDAFGGIQNLTTQLNSFYQEFYSEQEKYTNLTSKLTDVFASLGKTLPTTREDFRKMVEQAFSLKDADALKILMSVQSSVLEYLAPLEELSNSQKQYAETLANTNKTVVDEINRLRGQSTETSSSGLQSQFANLTRQARLGDINAYSKLPEVSKSLETMLVSNAKTYADAILIRANIAQSLQDTASYINNGGGFYSDPLLSNGISSGTASLNSSLSPINTTSASTSTSSTSELLSSLIQEVQGLRVEVRADVSANSKTSRILERVNQDGESLTITTLA